MIFKKIINNIKSHKIIDLGVHPYADTFIKKTDLSKNEPIYPLECYLNTRTGFIFNKVVTSAKDRYNLFDYSYTSSNSKYSQLYWKNFYNFIKKNILKKSDKILEIGSNDGYLCQQFKNNGYKTIGVDASEKMVNLANKNNIKTYNLIFDKKNSQILKKKFGKFDIIIANNVLNHSNDPFDFIKGVEKILAEKGHFVFEVPYWLILVKNKKFDQIYHEHISHFTVKSVFFLIKKSSLSIEDIRISEYHGGSLRIVCKKNGTNNKYIIKKFLDEEYKFKLFEVSTYKKIQENLKTRKLKFLKKIIDLKLKRKKIFGIGAAAKANTLINYLKLDKELIDGVTDISPLKVNKFTPLSRIPIYHDNFLKKFNEKIYVLILSWNISKILLTKLKLINKKIIFIKF
jgi:2-polyprenyl-3-methyl-5-hydroxy-6-metoxy-1,4-benzoquinol methylase